jgi:putative iron-regulated protein
MEVMKRFNQLLALVTGAGLLACSGCGDTDTKTAAVETYADIALASYEDSLTAGQALDTAIKTLVATPTADNLTAAQNAWLAAREPYLQTEVYRFYEGPIDNETDGPEGLLNAWPMDEHYLDYTADAPNGGLINDPTWEITAANVEGANEAGGEKNIATGYHAIEFLLWGQDVSDTGPGARPHTDYVTDGTGTAANQDRRGQYLSVCGDLLVTHLTMLRDAWAKDGSYSSTFVEGGDASLEKILTGMIVLAGFETGGERLQAALDAGDREEEHSCFSDNTHRDMIQDVQGIHNVFAGTYASLSGDEVTGKGVKDVISETDSAIADRLETEIEDALAKANGMEVPFEAEIVATNAEGNARVAALISALRTVEGTLEEVFVLMGFSVPVPE